VRYGVPSLLDLLNPVPCIGDAVGARELAVEAIKTPIFLVDHDHMLDRV